MHLRFDLRVLERRSSLTEQVDSAELIAEPQPCYFALHRDSLYRSLRITKLIVIFTIQNSTCHLTALDLWELACCNAQTPELGQLRQVNFLCNRNLETRF